ATHGKGNGTTTRECRVGPFPPKPPGPGAGHRRPRRGVADSPRRSTPRSGGATMRDPVLALVHAICVAGCGADRPADPPAIPPTPLTAPALGNSTLEGILPSPITLVDGAFTGEPRVEGSRVAERVLW